MIGDYTFKINDIDCDPAYSDDLKLDYTLRQGEYYHNVSLSGELTFVREDYDYIMAQPFDTRFNISIYYKTALYFSGYFTRIDCRENIDDRSIKVQVLPADAYAPILNGYDKIHDIIPLNPVLEAIQIDKRPLIQVYVSGSNTITCLLAGNYWEQEVINDGISNSDLSTKHFFAPVTNVVDIRITAQDGASATYNGIYSGVLNEILNEPGVYYRGLLHKVGSTDYIRVEEMTDGYNRYWYYIMFRNNIQTYVRINATSPFSNPEQPLLAGSGQSGTLQSSTNLASVFMRYLTNIEQVGDTKANIIPEDDLVQNNRNYKYVLGYALESIYVSTIISTTPTEYGKIIEGGYFAPPQSIFNSKFYPVAKDRWITASIWFAFNYLDWLVEEQWRDTYLLRDAYDLVSVIDKLLKQINPAYYFIEGNSQFLYGGASLKSDNSRLFLTQKTNILRGEYDQPAQKAEVSLKQILDMLYAIYGCKWHMDGNALHIEHISYYKKGHTYLSAEVLGLDLTTETHVRHYLPYTFQKNIFTYDKLELPESIRYKYSDSTTAAFNGKPIQVQSAYIELGRIEEISVGNFNPDIDYMLLNPADINNDGFALLAPIFENLADLVDRSALNYATNTGLNLLGNTYAQTGLNTSDFINVDPDSYYVGTHDGHIGCWYTKLKQFISWFSPLNVAIKPPATAAYARVCFVYNEENFRYVKGYFTEGYVLPYISISMNDVSYLVQNGYLSYFDLIPKYHVYDLPSGSVLINGEVFIGSTAVKKTKKQTLWITGLTDPDPIKLVKTAAGNGFIEKMTINLTSRRVDLSLKYDTY